MKLSLVVLTEGKQKGKVLNVTLAQFLIGRDPQCHLRPASPMISKRHCALIQRDGKAYIRDFDSTNGTLINDQPVKGEIELRHNDQLKVGPLLFSVQLEATPSVNRPTPTPRTKSSPALAATGARATPENKKVAKGGDASPPSKDAPASSESPGATGSDEDIAAMLLSLDSDDNSSSSPTATEEVPDGSTVMDVPAPTTEEATTPGKNDKDKKKPDGNTANAAKSILEKYMRRPRSSS